jgi:hypothetical protein
MEVSVRPITVTEEHGKSAREILNTDAVDGTVMMAPYYIIMRLPGEPQALSAHP